jgi:chemotaxis protein methyltransferase CheR
VIPPSGRPSGLPPPPEEVSSACRRVMVLLRSACGIHLKPGKEFMVDSRLAPRVRELGLSDLSAYLDRVEEDSTGFELETMVDLLTTNKTGFFRESRHFSHLVNSLRQTPRRGHQAYRIWSAACSTGQEPYSIAIACLEAGLIEVEILATDISRRVVAAARRGEYPAADLGDVPAAYRDRYFERAGVNRRGSPMWRVSQTARDRVSFAHLNLLGPWPMRGRFDAIFCRNVMMYFDWETQSRLVERLDGFLEPAGHLYVGLSECLGAKASTLEFVEAAVYRTRERAA